MDASFFNVSISSNKLDIVTVEKKTRKKWEKCEKNENNKSKHLKKYSQHFQNHMRQHEELRRHMSVKSIYFNCHLWDSGAIYMKHNFVRNEISCKRPHILKTI